MVKTYTAQSIDMGNHDWDFDVDGAGNVTALHIKGSVNYGDMTRGEKLDVWPLLAETQKAKMQELFNKGVQAFNNHFLS